MTVEPKITWIECPAGHIGRESQFSTGSDGIFQCYYAPSGNRYMLTDEGNAFVKDYFDLQQGGQYLTDYIELLASTLPAIYYVPDTWENYEKLKTRIDERFQADVPR